MAWAVRGGKVVDQYATMLALSVEMLFTFYSRNQCSVFAFFCHNIEFAILWQKYQCDWMMEYDHNLLSFMIKFFDHV